MPEYGITLFGYLGQRAGQVVAKPLFFAEGKNIMTMERKNTFCERRRSVKVTVKEDHGLEEDEVIIHCSYMDERIKKLVDYVRQFVFSLEGESDGKIYRIPIDDLCYIDSVDVKTFLYETKNAYRSRLTLTELEQRLHDTTFVRISKNCLLNVSWLKCVEPYVNHRMRAELKNGEKLLVSRNYIENLREKLRR